MAAVAEAAGAGGAGAVAVENIVEIVKTGLVKSVQFILPPLLLPAIIKELYRYAVLAPTVENENLIDPNYSIEVFKAFAATGGMLQAAEAGEVAEVLTEGVGEAIADALRHIITEPFEKVFSLYRGNREIDEDEIADAYSYGMIAPEVLGVMAGMNGYSSVSTAMLITKSVGMLYSNNLQTVSNVMDGLAARALDYRLDPFELGVSMTRSVLNGIDEVVRSEASRIYQELRQIIGRAFDRLRDAYHALYIAARLYDVNRQDADAFAAQAKGLADDADAYVDVFDKMEQDFAGQVLSDLVDRADSLIQGALEAYLDAIAAYVRVVAEVFAPLSKYLAEAVIAAYEEANRALSALAAYRPFVPQLPAAELAYSPGGAPLGEVAVRVGVVK